VPDVSRALIRRQDLFVDTPGFQPLRPGRPGRAELARGPMGHKFLFVLDITNPGLGWQLTRPGTVPRDVPRGVPIAFLAADGTSILPTKRRGRRKINPGNVKAHFNAVDRIKVGAKWARQMFRAEESIKSGRVKSKRKKRRRS